MTLPYSSDNGAGANGPAAASSADGTLPLVGDLGMIYQAPTPPQSNSGGSSGSSPASTPSGNSSGFVINVSYDQNVSSLPAGFVAAINYVVSYYESIFTAPITVNIDVGYGEIDGQQLQSDALGESETFLGDYSYSSIVNALAGVDPSAAASLPSSMPVNGTMWVGTAEAKALGLPLEQPSTDIDGYAGFSDVFPFTYNPNNRAVSGDYDFIGVVEHEFTEVMGRIDLFGDSIGGTTGYSLLDMFHYTAPGQHTYTGLTTNYFSANGGTTNLDYFNSNPQGDLGDWAGSAGSGLLPCLYADRRGRHGLPIRHHRNECSRLSHFGAIRVRQFHPSAACQHDSRYDYGAWLRRHLRDLRYRRQRDPGGERAWSDLDPVAGSRAWRISTAPTRPT